MSMEPRTAMAYWQNGTCYVHGSAQSQSFWMPGLARLLGVETKDVVLISENTGGGFGSKIGAYPIAALPGYFSKKIGRPVQLRVTREQEYYMGSARVGFQGWIKMGFGETARPPLQTYSLSKTSGRMQRVAMPHRPAARFRWFTIPMPCAFAVCRC